jgi:hypothetical protein
MTVPAVILQHTKLGEPLRQEEEVADRAGTRERTRHACGPRHVNRDTLTGVHRSRQRDSHHRPVVGVAIIRRDEPNRGRQIDPRAGGPGARIRLGGGCAGG